MILIWWWRNVNKFINVWKLFIWRLLDLLIVFNWLMELNLKVSLVE